MRLAVKAGYEHQPHLCTELSKRNVMRALYEHLHRFCETKQDLRDGNNPEKHLSREILEEGEKRGGVYTGASPDPASNPSVFLPLLSDNMKVRHITITIWIERAITGTCN
jgi:hypothetical protein